MKKIIALLLAVTFLFTMVGCDAAIESVLQQINGTTPAETTLAEIEETTPQETSAHTHNFVVSEKESKAAKCTTEGLEVKLCACGAREETPLEALGHNMRLQMETKPTCTDNGTTVYKCSRCTTREYVTADATGHNYDTSVEPSRMVHCMNPNCTSCYWRDYNGERPEEFVFNFTAEDEAAIDAKYNELLAMVEAADKYDPALHGFAETGALAEAFEAVATVFYEYDDLIMLAVSQRQLVEVSYYCDMSNPEIKAAYEYMSDYYNELIAQYYSLDRPFYDSCYREFYYQGMTDEEINEYLFDSDTYTNPEYTALRARNDEIEIEFLALPEAQQKMKLPELYAEFVANNNRIAQLLGYENYLEYAYKNVRDRDYTYQDASVIADMVREYISPVFAYIFHKWETIAVRDQIDIDTYYTQVRDSFFETYTANMLVNDYIDLLAFTSNPDKQISFSDEFNKLASNGNLFRGDAAGGAYVTVLAGANVPIVFFGDGYDYSFGVVHEFGHYMNDIYAADISATNYDFEQSYDLLEMHSQGNEMLYLAYLKEYSEYNEVVLNLIETQNMVNMFYSIVACMAIDVLEQAIYLNTYDGLNADIIMADGNITYDEYDFLYQSICEDFGAADVIGDYWQYGMTITSPCYYISYSVSALSVLQLYEMANTDGFDAAKDAYLKLFTYVDEIKDGGTMTTEEIFEYAGLLYFDNEELYISLNEYFLGK